MTLGVVLPADAGPWLHGKRPGIVQPLGCPETQQRRRAGRCCWSAKGEVKLSMGASSLVYIHRVVVVETVNVGRMFKGEKREEWKRES